MAFHQFLEKDHRRPLVCVILHQAIENIPVLVHGAPQVSSLTSNRHDVNLIHIPYVAK